MYTMYADASTNTPSYTHVSSYVVWRVRSPGLLGILMTKIWVILWDGTPTPRHFNDKDLGDILGSGSTWVHGKGGSIQHGGYIRVETPIWVMIEGFDDHIQQVECHNVDHIPRACLKLPPLAWSNGSRRVQEKPIKSDCVVCLRFRRCTWIAFPQRPKFHHCRQRAHAGDVYHVY